MRREFMTINSIAITKDAWKMMNNIFHLGVMIHNIDKEQHFSLRWYKKDHRTGKIVSKHSK